MNSSPVIHSIYIAPLAGQPMVQIPKAEIVAGQGIQGDRYCSGKGAFSHSKPAKIRHISLIALSGIEQAQHELENFGNAPFEAEETRRNILLSGISAQELNSLVGETFYLGELECKGVELCIPCERPAKLLQRKNFIGAFEARGGIRAEACSSGVLCPGDALTVTKIS